jgi:hypothetical protein
MPPIFVDGVEIKTLFVDGVEQASAFADGVEVFSSGEYQLDDFERSANGTPVSAHLMNTGQSWDTWSTNKPTIQPFKGLQQAFWSRTGSTSTAGFTMNPIFESGVLSVAFYAKVHCWWNRPGSVQSTGTYGQIYLDHDIDPVQNRVRFNLSSDPDISTETGLLIGNQNAVLQNIPMPWANYDTNYDAIIEFWTDGVQFQGRVTSGGQSALSNRFATIGIPNKVSVGSVEQFFGNTLKEAGISDWELQEYSPSSLPWPS